jgi:hypothetical protein
MGIVSIQKVIEKIERIKRVSLSKYPRKKIIYKSIDKSILVITPESKITNYRALVDLTKIQTEILEEYKLSLILFRLDNGEVLYTEYSILKDFLTQENITYNNRAFYHWKLHINSKDRTLKIKDRNSINLLSMSI